MTVCRKSGTAVLCDGDGLDAEACVRRQAQILVVEDDKYILQILTLLFTDEGFAVQSAPDCEAALSMLHEAQPDLIVLDVRLPVMDGWAFLDIYHQTAGSHVPVIVTSAAYGSAERAAQHGAAAFLSKPFDLEQLLALVYQHIPAAQRAVTNQSALSSPPPAV